MLFHGGCLNARASRLCSTGRHLFVPSGTAVRVHSSVTGERICVLDVHESDVTAVCPHEKDPSLVYTASLDGFVKLSDFRENKVKHAWKATSAVHDMVLLSERQALLSCIWGQQVAGRIMLLNLDAKPGLTKIAKLSSPVRLALSPDGKFAAACERCTLHLLDLRSTPYKHVKLHHTRALTCAAFDATTAHVAAGDCSGRILVWSGLGSLTPAHPDRRTAGMALTTLHWHAHAVGALCFSQDGAYLLSGGQESVFVIWQLQTLKKTFLPLQSTGIVHIDRCPTDVAQYVVGQADNTVRLVSLSTMQVVTSVIGVRSAQSGSTLADVGARAVMHPGSGYIVLPCDDLQLQFYDVMHDKHVARVAVVPRSIVSTGDKKTAADTSEGALNALLTSVSFSQDASCMVSIEAHPSPTALSVGEDQISKSLHVPLCRQVLKFWDAVPVAAVGVGYCVNSVMSAAQQSILVAAVCHPDGQEVSVVEVHGRTQRGQLRVWVKQQAKRQPGQQGPKQQWFWSCQRVAEYQGLSMQAAVYSQDGSILAVAAGPCVALWETEAYDLTATLAPPLAATGSTVQRMLFLPSCPHLVTTHHNEQDDSGCICVWNLLTLALSWILPGIRVLDLAAHPTSSRFAVLQAMHSTSGAKSDGVAVLVYDALKGPEWACRAAVCSRGSDDYVTQVMYAEPSSVLHYRVRERVEKDSEKDSVQSELGVLMMLTMQRRIMITPDIAGVGEDSQPSLAANAVAKAAPKLLEGGDEGGGRAEQLGLLGKAVIQLPDTIDAKNGLEILDTGTLDRRAVESVPPVLDLTDLDDVPSHLLEPVMALCERKLCSVLLHATGST